MSSSSSFTGRSRGRSTRRSVLFVDRAARWIIAVGGIGTILAVLAVALFLVWVVLPLFLPAQVEEPTRRTLSEAELLGVGVDEYRLLSWRLRASGDLDLIRLDDGSVLESRRLAEQGALRSAAISPTEDQAALGLQDGTIRLVEIGFATEIRNFGALPEDVAKAIRAGEAGSIVAHEGGVAQRTPQGQARLQRLAVKEGQEARLGGPVLELTLATRSSGLVLAAVVGPRPILESEESEVDEDQSGQVVDLTEVGTESSLEVKVADVVSEPRPPWTLVVLPTREKSDFLTGRKTRELLDPIVLPTLGEREEPPSIVRLGSAGNELWLGWRDGWIQRIEIRDLSAPRIAESGSLIPDGELTAFDFVLGNTTLVWGSSTGDVSAGFLARTEELTVPDAPGLVDRDLHPDATTRLVVTKVLAEGRGTPVLSFGQSIRSRLMLVGYGNGEVDLYNVTNAALLKRATIADGEPIRQLVFAPKEDGLLAFTETGYASSALDPRYPEASLEALFLPVWYEGYPGPDHVWQSSSGSDDFEMKLGLMPLIFGTIKATVYSMLIGAPLALLAAIFTSEFLDPRTRGIVKPSIELMASLPSVVLGFLAALVFAPVVEKVVPTTLALFATLPFVFLAGAAAWQLLPGSVAIRLENRRFLFVCATLPMGFLLATWIGPLMERVFFAGDLRAWLAWDGGADTPQFASATGGWMFLFLPLSALAVALTQSKWVSPWMRGRSADWSRREFAIADALRLFGLAVSTLVLAWVLSAVFSALGFDPRGSYIDTYGQRNALIVGFAMGFAVIPIIYTISEDALSTVPEHLRSASLGAGATRWQTAVRIVLPTAMSGLFSALMIGLGRAVGETMIVLMAAGNTPVMDWNVFSGFRTLSANIAVELPEAVRNSTHYRTLFLAALALFVMTFVLNTVAEVVRLRFRKRAYQL